MQEKIVVPSSGYPGLLAFVALLATGLYLLLAHLMIVPGILLILLSALILVGVFFLNPNNAYVLTLLGEYKGTVKQNGFFWANPFYQKKAISLRARNFESERIKVNDKQGNPILISVILVWHVKDAFKASFEVDNFETFVKIQSEAAVRKLAAMYPYDNFEDTHVMTLRSGLEEVNHSLERELAERLSIAGVEVFEARIGYLAYAQEIAGSMLKRQQAEAVVAARFKIVEGAVGMVENALAELARKGIVDLDSDKKAAMVSNLMVVLCGDREASPVVNAGTLNQ